MASVYLGKYPQLSWEGVEDICAVPPAVAGGLGSAEGARGGREESGSKEATTATVSEAGGGSALLVENPAVSVGEVKTRAENVAPTVAPPESIVEGLNPQQHEAVTYPGDTLLVLAGAGSGKTRVLTRRVAWLLATQRCKPWQILAITFTNKAASEMRERVEQMVGEQAAGMWVATFHSACSRILRQYGQVVGLKKNFTIYDTAATKRALALALDEEQIDAKKHPVKAYASQISNCKNSGLGWQEVARGEGGGYPYKFADVFRRYQQRLLASNAVDFDDLLLHTVALLRQSPDVSYALRRKFRHVLVDEYQDTNHVQYQLVKLICGRDPAVAHPPALPPLTPSCLTVVGDPDQSIYAFRGADVRNIEQFESDFPGAHRVFLEQNYRSTNRILEAANQLIKANHSQHSKRLWSELGDGEKVGLRVVNSGFEEALALANTVSALAEEGYKYSDVAVLYRTNSLSREIEEQLLRAGIPTRVLGGTRFYDRAEIKDALALLTLVVNQDDEVALLRVINTPKRGLGDAAIAKLRAEAQRRGVSLGEVLGAAWWHTLGLRHLELCRPELVGLGAGETPALAAGEIPAGVAAQNTSEENAVSRSAANGKKTPALAGAPVPVPVGIAPKQLKACGEFWHAIVQARHRLWQGEGVGVVLQGLLSDTGYLQALRLGKDPQDASRIENLSELHNVARTFDMEQQQGTLADFLERVALVADTDQLEENELGAVTLMTVHTAKGLEYPVVWLAGWEQGTFPHELALGEPGGPAEERRLAYVAITRARERLYVSCARTRMQWGQTQRYPLSQFVQEIPEEVWDVPPRAQAGSQQGVGRTGLFGWGEFDGEPGVGDAVDFGGRGDGYASGFGRGHGGEYGRTGRATRSTILCAGPESRDLEGAESSPRRASVSGLGAGGGRKGTIKRLGSAVGSNGANGAASGDPERLRVMQVGEGARVSHSQHGEGTVVTVEGQGAMRKAVVQFESGERKRLLLRLAPLTVISD